MRWEATKIAGAEEGHDPDEARHVERTLTARSLQQPLLLPVTTRTVANFSRLSRTFLNRTSGPPLSTLYLLILTTDELSPTSPVSVSSLLLSSGWFCPLLRLCSGSPSWGYLLHRDGCGLHSLFMKCCSVELVSGAGGLQINIVWVRQPRKSMERKGERDVCQWNCPCMWQTIRELSSTYKVLWERIMISSYFLWEFWASGLWDFFWSPWISRYHVQMCVCAFLWGEITAFLVRPLNGFITMSGCICNIGHASALTYVQA